MVARLDLPRPARRAPGPSSPRVVRAARLAPELAAGKRSRMAVEALLSGARADGGSGRHDPGRGDPAHRPRPRTNPDAPRAVRIDRPANRAVRRRALTGRT